MSDLDADLYGDLYGNDDDGFNTADGPKDVPKPEGEDAFDGAPSPTQDTKPLSTAPIPSAVSAPAKLANGISAQAKLPALNPPPAQPIQTYQQQQYDEAPAPRQPTFAAVSPTANGGASPADGDRAVRPSEMKDEGKMFIGGLNWDTSDETLKQYFEQFGKVDACTIMRDAAGRSRCFAFLTFEDPASVNAVMVREHFLDGKVIDPKRAIPRTEHQRATKLFIGGLAGSVTSESMREFFSQFGRVVDSTVMLDRETGRSKGFGFISLEDVDVGPLLGFGNLEIDGKLIDVKLAQPRHQRDNFQENAGGQSTGGGGAGRGNFQNSGAAAAAGGSTPAGGTPFDPQALAALYTRMFQVNGGMNGGMAPGPMGGMGMGGMGMGGMGMGGMGMGGMGMGGMGMGGGMGAMQGGPMAGGGMPMGGGMGMGRGGQMGGMGRGGPPMGPMAMAGGPMGNVPRGPRAGTGGPPGMGGVGGGMGIGGPGPQRSGQRGQHNYHPYAR